MNNKIKIFLGIMIIIYGIMISLGLKTTKSIGTVSNICILGDTNQYEYLLNLEGGGNASVVDSIEYEIGDDLLVGKNFFGYRVIR